MRMLRYSAVETKAEPKAEPIASSSFLSADVLRRIAYFSRADEAVRFMQERIRDRITLDDVASFVGMERTSLSRFFTEKIGLTFTELVRILKIEHAIAEMRVRDCTVAELSDQLGFVSTCTFSRAFKDVTGMTPSEYRRTIRDALQDAAPAHVAFVGSVRARRPGRAVQRAVEIAHDIGGRLAAADDLGTQLPSQRGLGGYSGLALLFSALYECTSERRFLDATHRALRSAGGCNEGPSIGLFEGLGGLLFALRIAQRHEPRYADFAATTLARYEEIAMEIPQDEPARSFDKYDLVHGAAGVCLSVEGYDAPVARERAQRYLLWLLQDESRWRCVHPLDPESTAHNDLGMAHGAAGMLAALSLVPLEGSDVEPTIAALAKRLCDLRLPGLPRYAWPAMHRERRLEPTRAAWCYGTPGVAASIFVAARRLNDPELERIAVTALEQQAGCSIGTWLMRDHFICHGSIGNALILASVGRATQNPVLLEQSDRLMEMAVDAFDESIFGYRTEHVIGGEHCPPGLLDGAAGIALGFLSLADEIDTMWMKAFGLLPLS